MITLAGGTGLVGRTLTQALVRDGEQVRVLTRDPEAAATTFGDAKLEIVGVDFDDTATLRSGFTGSEKAYLSTGPPTVRCVTRSPSSTPQSGRTCRTW